MNVLELFKMIVFNIAIFMFYIWCEINEYKKRVLYNDRYEY